MQQEKQIRLRTLFMGTSDFAEKILKTLLENGFNLVGVYTKPDSLVGRKKEVSESPVKKLAKANDIKIYQPEKFTSAAIEELSELEPDMIIVAAYGKILPKKILEIPGFGCLNIHPSLLPKFRGPSPIQNALLLGEKETGTTLMLMDEGMDTGDIIAQERMNIDDNDNIRTLSEKLSQLSASLLLENIEAWIEGRIEPIKQDDSLATLCQLIEREDGRIIWEQEKQEIYNRFKAFFPWPGIFTFWKNGDSVLRIKLLRIKILDGFSEISQPIGKVFNHQDEVCVQTLNGAIILEEIQLEGKSPMTAKEFVNGYGNFIGSMLI